MNENKKPRCMISQPMAGLTNEEIEKTRAKAIETVTAMGYEYVSSYGVENDTFHPEENPDILHPRIAYLGRALGMLSKCNAMYFCNGWKNSSGCIVEHTTCIQYGLERIYEEPSRDDTEEDVDKTEDKIDILSMILNLLDRPIDKSIEDKIDTEEVEDVTNEPIKIDSSEIGDANSVLS